MQLTAHIGAFARLPGLKEKQGLFAEDSSERESALPVLCPGMGPAELGSAFQGQVARNLPERGGHLGTWLMPGGTHRTRGDNLVCGRARPLVPCSSSPCDIGGMWWEQRKLLRAR